MTIDIIWAYFLSDAELSLVLRGDVILAIGGGGGGVASVSLLVVNKCKFK